MRAWSILSLVVVFTALPACSSGSKNSDNGSPAAMTPTVVSQMVTATGGGVVTAGGAELDVPPGALAEDTTITVTESSKSGEPMADAIAGDIYDFGPEGTTFAQPVQLSISFDGSIPDGKQAVIAFLDQGAWTPLDDSVVAGNVVLAHTSHFSTYTVVFVDSMQTGPTCSGTFDACGGDLTGTWDISIGCANVVPADAPIANCPGSRVSVTAVPTGSITFDPTSGTMFLNAFYLALDVSGTFPASCVTNGDCATAQTATTWNMLTFTKNGSTCSVTGQSGIGDNQAPQTETQMLMVSGAQFYTQEAGASTPSGPFDYCVQGDTLTVQATPGQNGSVVQFSGTRE